MRPALPALPALSLVTALTLLTTGGCSVDARRTPTTDSSVALEVRESQRLRLDLREPLTREEAGLGSDRFSVSYDRRAPRFLDTELVLPEGEPLQLQAISATISSGGDGTTELPPERLLVVTVEPDVAAGERALTAAAERFAFPAAQVERVRAALRDGRTGATGFVETEVGYLRLTLDVRLSEADGRVQLSYRFGWEPGSS